MIATPYLKRTRPSNKLFHSEEINRFKTFYRHQNISLKEGYLWRVKEGFVRTITISESGDIRVLGIWGNGNVLGLPLNRDYPFQIECMSTVKACLIQENSIIGEEWMLPYLQQTESLLAIQYHNLVRDRLLLFLQWLANRFGYPLGDGRSVGIRLTHQEISEAINSTRVTVTRALNELEAEGYLGWLQRTCVLLTPSKQVVTP